MDVILLTIKRRHWSEVEVLEQVSSQEIGESLANAMFKEEKAHCVSVVEVKASGKEKVNVLYRITRKCKHPRIQGRFDFAAGAGQMLCEDCELELGNKAIINPALEVIMNGGQQT